MTKNEITYKGIKISKQSRDGHKGRYFLYEVDLKVIAETGTRFFTVRDSSLNGIKDQINGELKRGAKAVDGSLVH